MAARMLRRTNRDVFWGLLGWIVAVGPLVAAQEPGAPAPVPSQEQEPPVQKTEEPAVQGLVGILPAQPPDLLGGLDQLRSEGPAGPDAPPWQQRVAEVLEVFDRLYQGAAPEAAEVLDRTAQLDLFKRLQAAEQALADDIAQAPDELAGPLRVFHSRVNRRISLLQGSFEAVEALQPPTEEQLAQDRDGLQQSLAQLDRLLSTWSTGDGWRKYLRFPEIQELAGKELAEVTADRITATSQRFETEGLEPLYRDALEREQFVGVRTALQQYAGDLRRQDPSVAEEFRGKLSQLWSHLERYEESQGIDAAKAVQEMSRELVSIDPAGQKIADALAAHYRRANVWLAISRVLVQKFLPGTQVEQGTVRERRGETYVSGRQVTRATPQVRFYESKPAAFAIELEGMVETSFVASQERADVAGTVQTGFLARRRIDVTEDGLRAGEPQIGVRASGRVSGADVRGAGLFGGIARRRATEIGQRELSRSRPETEARVAREVLNQFNPEVDGFVEKFNEQSQKIRQRWKEGASGAVDIESRSTEHWLLIDVAFAGDDQLGAWSPRLSTPPGTLGAFQIHETAVNNALARAELAGKTYSREELKNMIQDATTSVVMEEGQSQQPPRQPAPSAQKKADEPLTPLTTTFAPETPVRVRLEQGLAELTVRATGFEGLDFQVGPRQIRARYRPVLTEEDFRLVREGEILVEPLGSTEQGADDPEAVAKLRRVLEEIFEPEMVLGPHPISVPFGEEGREVELRLLGVDIADGWLALAIG